MAYKTTEDTLAVGDRVQVLVATPTGDICTGTVRVLNDPEKDPGHQVGVELDEYVVGAHSLEGVVDEREDPRGGRTVGKGWWSRPEYLNKLDK